LDGGLFTVRRRPRIQIPKNLAELLKLADRVSAVTTIAKRRRLAQFTIGASVLRKEDDQFLRGRGQYVGDLHFSQLAL
jgi:hypothetical protein